MSIHSPWQYLESSVYWLTGQLLRCAPREAGQHLPGWALSPASGKSSRPSGDWPGLSHSLRAYRSALSLVLSHGHRLHPIQAVRCHRAPAVYKAPLGRKRINPSGDAVIDSKKHVSGLCPHFSGPELLKPLEFPSGKSHKGVLMFLTGPFEAPRSLC